MAVDQSLMVLPDNKQKQGVYRRGSVAKSPSEGAAALRTDVKGASEAAEVASFLGEVTKWFPTYGKEIDKKNKEEMEEQVAEYKNASPGNKLAFRQAIATGDIEGRFSPWKMEGLRKAKAQEETRNYGNALFSKYMKSPARSSDDPEVMRNFIDQHNSEFKENITGIPNNILNDDFFPTRDALINSLIQRHKEHRANEFDAKETESVTNQLHSAADGLVPPGSDALLGTTKNEGKVRDGSTDILNMCQGKDMRILTKSDLKKLYEIQSTLPDGELKETTKKVLVSNGHDTGDYMGPTSDDIDNVSYFDPEEPAQPENVVDIVQGGMLTNKKTEVPQTEIVKEKVTAATQAPFLNSSKERGESGQLEEPIKSVDSLAYDDSKPATGLVSFKGHTKKSKQEAQTELKKLEKHSKLDIGSGKFVLRKSGYGYQIVLVQSEKSKKRTDGKEILSSWLGEIQKGFGYGFAPGTAGAKAHTVTTQQKWGTGKGWDEKKK